MLGLFISLAWFTLLGVTGTLTGWQLLTILPLVFVLTMLTTARSTSPSIAWPTGRCAARRGWRR